MEEDTKSEAANKPNGIHAEAAANMRGLPHTHTYTPTNTQVKVWFKGDKVQWEECVCSQWIL